MEKVGGADRAHLCNSNVEQLSAHLARTYGNQITVLPDLLSSYSVSGYHEARRTTNGPSQQPRSVVRTPDAPNAIFPPLQAQTSQASALLSAQPASVLVLRMPMPARHARAHFSDENSAM